MVFLLMILCFPYVFVLNLAKKARQHPGSDMKYRMELLSWLDSQTTIHWPLLSSGIRVALET